MIPKFEKRAEKDWKYVSEQIERRREFWDKKELEWEALREQRK